jgi:hypothetical protein
MPMEIVPDPSQPGSYSVVQTTPRKSAAPATPRKSAARVAPRGCAARAVLNQALGLTHSTFAYLPVLTADDLLGDAATRRCNRRSAPTPRFGRLYGEFSGITRGEVYGD